MGENDMATIRTYLQNALREGIVCTYISSGRLRMQRELQFQVFPQTRADFENDCATCSQLLLYICDASIFQIDQHIYTAIYTSTAYALKAAKAESSFC